jgi:hypothetical protein
MNYDRASINLALLNQHAYIADGSDREVVTTYVLNPPPFPLQLSIDWSNRYNDLK